MRNIIVGAQVSTDGVMQAPGRPTEDPTKGFNFGGRAMSFLDQAGGEEMRRTFKDFDLLLSRKTYEIFAGCWPCQGECAPHGGIAKAFNDAKEFVVSRSGELDTNWKQMDGPNLVTQGAPNSSTRCPPMTWSAR